MKDNNTSSKLKNLRIDDDYLETVSGGTQDDFSVTVSGHALLYTSPSSTPRYAASVDVGAVLTGLTHINATWYSVPVSANKNQLKIRDHNCLNYKYLCIQNNCLKIMK